MLSGLRAPSRVCFPPRSQGPRQERSRQTEPGVEIAASGADVESGRGDAAAREANHQHYGTHGGDRGWVGEDGEEDSRPKLVPGAMLTLSHQGVEAIMAFTEEVKVLSLKQVLQTLRRCGVVCCRIIRSRRYLNSSGALKG